MDSNNNIYNKINIIEEQIKTRLSIPPYERTEKQAIKLDNLLFELQKLYKIINKDKNNDDYY